MNLVNALRWPGALALLAATLLSLAVTPSVSAAAEVTSPAEAIGPLATPAVGGPSSLFTFVASGFTGDVDDGENDKTNGGELVSFWMNTPDGKTIRVTRDGSDKHSSNASSTRASRAGTVKLVWRASADAPLGAYTLVAHGNASGHEVVIAFRIEGKAHGIPISTPNYTVTPTVNKPGATFAFVVNGFNGDVDEGEHDNSNDAEMVSFWINMPDGQAVRALAVGADKDADDAGVIQASRAGQVQLTWLAPASAAPGMYTLVAHGLKSELEQVIVFEIR